MRRLVRDQCDELICIPMSPGTDSLNAAVAGSIVLSHIWAQRAAALADA
jgi:tRNA G18 (ribose-2'-O)-methylase SpoU